ncbi:uncharacterized protein LOC117181228 [Belonocnema kinseyi]|uniref:uncharacterized protein LOC117181228 n=1 Tax=Belonocnema kinseyi TaxID=2817044 RepID=UPI00143D3316|nr:uncharacterized protein LOC117181228 [Belonocnema kinseyi]
MDNLLTTLLLTLRYFMIEKVLELTEILPEAENEVLAMAPNFTDHAPPHSRSEVSVAINFSLGNQSQYEQTRNDSERAEASTRQYESLPFASTETTFSTNPFLPRMTDPAGSSSSWHNNIVGQNDHPTYLPSAYDSFFNLENPAGITSRNSISTNQNSGLASNLSQSSNSSHLSDPTWSTSGRGSWVSSNETASLPSHSARTTTWGQNSPNTNSASNSMSRTSILSRGTDSGTILNSSWSSNSSNQLNQPTYLPNNNGIFGQPQVNPNSGRTIPCSAASISSVAPPNQFNQRIVPEVNPRTEIFDPEDCVVITTVERRYIYGRGEMTRSDEPNIIDSFGPGPSNASPILCRTHQNTINRDHPLQSRTYCRSPSLIHSCNGELACNCNRQFRSHPYMSIVPSSLEGQLNSERNSGRIPVQIGSRRTSVFGRNRGLPPFESINLTPNTREINETRSWGNPATRLINNSFAQYTTNEVANRGMIQAEDPFSVDLTNDEVINVDNLRPSISLADVEGLPNLMGSVNSTLHYPRNELLEFNINNISNHSGVNNSAHNMILHHQNTSTFRNTVLENRLRQSMDTYELYRRRYAQAMRDFRAQRAPYYVNETRTTSRHSQTETMTTTLPPPSYSQSYKRKKEAFRSMLKPPVGVPKNFEIKIKRSTILEDSYRIITTVDNVEKLKAKLWVVFEGEVGLDYGGVQREWFCLLSREIFNPNYGLFEYCTTSNYSLQINPNSGICNEEHLNYFMFIGRVVGMAIYHEKLLDASFTSTFYKMLLQKKITLEDLKKVDPQYYQTLSWIKDNDPAHLELDFTVNEEHFGHVSIKDLVANGSKIPVTNMNKQHYIDLFIMWRFVSRIKDQMEAFLMGFHDLIPKKALKNFNENELEPLICGIQQIDYKDWKMNTAYSGGYSSRHQTIRYFWKIVSKFNNEMRSKLLQFVTGTSRVPMNGFKELIGSNGPLLFTIQNIGSCDSLPRAHTCDESQSSKNINADELKIVQETGITEKRTMNVDRKRHCKR